jgi:hypothetical protein
LTRCLNVANPSKSSAAWADDLAEALVALPVNELIRKANRAHVRLGESGSGAEDDGGAIEAVAGLLLPVVFDHAVVQSVGTSVSPTEAALISLPAGTRSVAEIIMAGVDRRPAEFRTPEGELEFPEGELSLGVPPECGRDPTCAEFQKAWNDHLIEKFVSERDRESFRHDYQKLVELAADELAHLANEYRRIHYFIFNVPRQETERRTWEAIIRKLKTQYVAIVFISLCPEFKQVRHEERLLRPLRDLLRRSRAAG